MQMIHGMTVIEFDTMVASRYGMKAHNARQRGKTFDLTLAQFRALYKRKNCAYTGVKLSYRRNDDGSLPPNYATLERIDNNKGYVLGNVVIVTTQANNAKSIFEDKLGLDLETAVKMFTTIGKHLK